MNDLPVYGVDLGIRRIAIAGPDGLLAALILSDPRPGQADFVTPREVSLLGSFLAIVVPPEATIWLERPFLGRGNLNTKTAIRLGMTVGAVLARHAGTGKIVDQAHWKAHVVANGNASKDDVRDWLWREAPQTAEACAGDQDLLDACCIRHFGCLVAEGRVEEPRQLSRRPKRGHVRRNRQRPADEPKTGQRRTNGVRTLPGAP